MSGSQREHSSSDPSIDAALTLRQTEAGFREFIDRNPDAVFVRRGAEIVHVNDALVSLLGYARDELLGADPLSTFLHPDSRAEAMQHRATSPDRSDLREHRWVRKDGQDVFVETVGVSVTFEGAPARIVMCRDLTERNRLQSKLLLADRLASIGTLAAGIAHEINNPLTYIIANLDMVAEDLSRLYASDGTAKVEMLEMLGEARSGAERVRRIVLGLKTFIRTDDERRVPVDLRAVIDSAVALAFNELRHRARLIRRDHDVPPVLADEGRLVQVFVNLLVNAAHAIPLGDAGRNEIRIDSGLDESGRVSITVSDTGVGMSETVRSRIFDPFFTTKGVGEGTGLGLSICHNIVTGLGGEISVESTTGRGTTIRVILPASPTAIDTASAVHVASAASAEPRRGRVLVVDDDVLVGVSVRRVLKDYDVVIVHSGRAALELLATIDTFDCILCDVMMPEMTGLELLAALRSSAPRAADKIVFLTGGTFTSSATTALEGVTNPRLDKPFTLEALRAAVGRGAG